MLLGEARSKCEHLAKVPMRSDTATDLHQVFLVKGVMATTAIEGNTLSEDEVRQRLEGKLDLPPSKAYLGIEVDNIRHAVDGVVQDLYQRRECDPVSPGMLQGFNREVLKNLSSHIDDWVVPGEFRHRGVAVGDAYLAPPAEAVEYLVERMSDWLNSDFFASSGERRLEMGILRAIVAHLYIAWIHPFGDGNGRVARLVEWQQLLRAGVPVPAAFALSNHYNVTRTEYYRALNQANKTPHGVVSFINYALRGFVDGLRDQIKIVHRQQQSLAWQDWLWQFFAHAGNTPAAQRRHMLVLVLTNQPMTRSEIMSMAAYGERSGKTLTRDLGYLMKHAIVRREGHTYIGNKELLYQYLPVCTEMAIEG